MKTRKDLGKRVTPTVAGIPVRLKRKGKLLVVPKQGKSVDAVKAVDQTRADRVC
jgi:hypothetical protein